MHDATKDQVDDCLASHVQVAMEPVFQLATFDRRLDFLLEPLIGPFPCPTERCLNAGSENFEVVVEEPLLVRLVSLETNLARDDFHDSRQLGWQ